MTVDEFNIIKERSFPRCICCVSNLDFHLRENRLSSRRFMSIVIDVETDQIYKFKEFEFLKGFINFCLDSWTFRI